MIPVTEQLAEFVAGLSWEALPSEVQVRIRMLFTDWMANTIGGQPQESTGLLTESLADAGILDGRLRAPGASRTTSPYSTALLAAAAAHTLDFDDTHAASELHPGAPVMAAALAAAQQVDADIPTLLTGFVAGYEVMTRVALGLPSTPHRDRGFHLTASVGIFGSAAAAGAVLGLESSGIQDAFGTGLSRAAGSGQYLANGAWTKRYHVGAAAADGLLAAILARNGYTGATEAFEGQRGFFRMYSDAPRPDLAVAGLGVQWQVLDTAVKPYPCCRHSHSALDGVSLLMRESGLRADEVVRLEVGMSRGSMEIVGVPQERKRDPRNVVDGQFSAHFCLAALLVHGSLRYEAFDAALADPRVRELMARIDVSVDDEADAAYPKYVPARLRVERCDGSHLEVYQDIPLGEPENMVSTVELQQKFFDLVIPVLGLDGAHRLRHALEGLLESGASVRELVELTVPGAARC